MMGLLRDNGETAAWRCRCTMSEQHSAIGIAPTWRAQPHPCEDERPVPDRTAFAHISAVTTVKLATPRVSDECVKTGARWVPLRTCQTCGATLCCDSSLHRHASAHARATSHPVVASAEPGERWLYCYPDEAFAEY